jgi:hypothetical protein
MTTVENKTFEYRAFVLGVIVLGGFFGAFIFRNASEFWGPAPTWSLAGSVGASLLLCLVPVLSYRPQSGVKVWMFLVSLALTVGLVMYYDAGHDLPGSAAGGVKGLLRSIQLANSWEYRLFVLIPIILSILAHWVCGGFLLSLKRFFAGRKNKSLPQSRALFASTTAGVAMLVAFTFGISASIESGSFFVGLQYPEGISGERGNVEIARLKAEMLERFEDLESIDVFIGRVDVDHAVASSIFEQQILLVLNQGDRGRRGKARKWLERSFREIGLEVFDTTDRPSVPIRETYTSTEINFVPNSALLERLGITETALSAALATRLRLSSGDDSLQTLQRFKFMFEGQYIEVNQLGSFEVISTEIKGADLPAPHWEIFSQYIVSQDIDDRLPGIAITLNEDYVARFGLDLGEVEATIMEHLSAENSSTDIDFLSQLPIIETQDKGSIRLGDIARIEQTRITNPQGEVNGVPYKIQLNVR